MQSSNRQSIDVIFGFIFHGVHDFSVAGVIVYQEYDVENRFKVPIFIPIGHDLWI